MTPMFIGPEPPEPEFDEEELHPATPARAAVATASPGANRRISDRMGHLPIPRRVLQVIGEPGGARSPLIRSPGAASIRCGRMRSPIGGYDRNDYSRFGSRTHPPRWSDGGRVRRLARSSASLPVRLRQMPVRLRHDTSPTAPRGLD